MSSDNIIEQVAKNGFCVVEDIYSRSEIDMLLSLLSNTENTGKNFRVSNDLFAIRQVLKEIPGLIEIIFNSKLKSIIEHLNLPGYFVAKSIYFNKPEQSNWVVAWHRDLTINVRDKNEHYPGFKGWIKKDDQYSVQPPREILRSNITIRIHLDDTNKENGALKVIPGSHKDDIDHNSEAAITNEQIVSVKTGGIMIMKPMLLHASGRTTNGMPRRVLHIEISNCNLPAGIEWSEYAEVTK